MMLPDPLDSQKALTRASVLGRYTVLGMIGKGAMGEVYAAYDPQLDRKIAIKLVRIGRDRGSASEGRVRLMREAQAIAKLSHPNVVTVYDVGTFHEDVFIAMQFVDGNTLGYWVHAEPRKWQEILAVYADAGRGLAAAHEKGLIHRDFKPENVMISADGGVRVMDFGLARGVLEREIETGPTAAPAPHGGDHPGGPPREAAGDSTDVETTRAISMKAAVTSGQPGGALGETLNIRITQTGALLGTPAYMSPEQFHGSEIDERTDQFSFCVALYEALYGERPFVGRTLNDIAESVGKGDIRPPPAASKVPTWVRKIVVRGLQGRPKDRWPSMKDLVAALDKSRIGGSPRRQFAANAAAKLGGIWEPPPRRRRAVLTPVKAEIREAFLATGKRYAEAAFEKTSALLDRYAQRWCDMYTDACEATHVRGEQSGEIFDLRMASLEEGLDSLRALSQVFREANAEVVGNAVSAASALGNLERCADVKLLRAVVRPPDDPLVRAEVDRLRTRLAEIRILCSVGRLTEGLKLIGPLEEEVRRIGYAPLLAETLFELGNLHIERRDATVAAVAFEEGVWTAELSRHDEVAAKAAAQLVYVVGDAQLRFDAGEIWARHADTLLRRMGGHEYLWGWLYNNRGAMRERQGRLADAVEDARRAVAAKERVHGPESAEVGMSLGNVAINLEQLGDVEGAVEIMARALQILETCLGPEHPRTAILLSNYGEILNRLGRFEEAARMCTRAIANFETESAPDGVILSYPLTALGLAYLGCGQPDRALPVLERAAEIRDAKESKATCLGEVHFALACALSETRTDLSRARALTLRAREEYAREPPNPVTKWALTQIDFWLESNRAEPIPVGPGRNPVAQL